MPIQLDKILADIAEEKTLHPNYPNPQKKQTDDAWMRVGKKNKLSVHECRSIFKVLQKKYEQERHKESSPWKLFSIMDDIHKKIEVKNEVKNEAESEPEAQIEEDEEYEMLEVQEEEEQSAAANVAPNNGSGSPTQNESPNKSVKSNSSRASVEKEEKPLLRNPLAAQKTSPQVEERKILNALPNAAANKAAVGSTTSTSTTTSSAAASAAAAAALQKKGITMKKTVTSNTVTTKITTGSIANSSNNKTAPVRAGNCTLLEVGKTIQLPESIKRKLSEDQTAHSQNKRSNLSQAAVAAANASASASSASNNISSPSQQLTAIKQERCDNDATNIITQPQSTHGINLITIPANPTRNDLTNGVGSGTSLIIGGGTGGPTSSTAATVASTSTNGYSPRLEEIDFRNDIIFDTGNGHGLNGTQQQAVNRVNNNRPSEIINLGNFDQALPPTFFKNLCNSSRHEALGLYVANVMNRLGQRSAAKLELGILRAIIDVQSDELEQ